MLIVQQSPARTHLGIEVCAGRRDPRDVGFVQSNGFESAQGRFLAVPSRPQNRALVATLPCSEAAATGRWRVMKSLT